MIKFIDNHFGLAVAVMSTVVWYLFLSAVMKIMY